MYWLKTVRSNIVIFLYYVIFLSCKYDVICDVMLLVLTLVITKITSLQQLPNFPPVSKIPLNQTLLPHLIHRANYPSRHVLGPPCTSPGRGGREGGAGERAEDPPSAPDTPVLASGRRRAQGAGPARAYIEATAVGQAAAAPNDDVEAKADDDDGVEGRHRR